jgi:hypothetical protein
MEREWKIGERGELGDNILWFDRLTGSKQIQAMGNMVSVRIGFRREVKSEEGTSVLVDTIEVDANSIGQALRYARSEYEFLTLDTVAA